MTVHQDDLQELLDEAYDKAAQLERKANRLREEKTQKHYEIQHNNEQRDRVKTTVDSLEFLIATLDFGDDE